MLVVIIKTNEERRDGRGFLTIPFECDYPDIEALEDALREKRSVSGNRLNYNKLNHFESRIRDRAPWVVKLSDVRGMQVAKTKFLEPM